MTPLDLMFVWFEGPADLGRIHLTISSKGFVKARYEHHPMVISPTAPWAKEARLGPEAVAELFRVVQTKEVRNTRFPELLLMPGQDVVLMTLSAAFGKTPPFLAGSFVEVPVPLVPVLAELKKLYDSVK